MENVCQVGQNISQHMVTLIKYSHLESWELLQEYFQEFKKRKKK